MESDLKSDGDTKIGIRIQGLIPIDRNVIDKNKGIVIDNTIQAKRELLIFVGKLAVIGFSVLTFYTVSYTHLTLPTKRIV